MKTVKAILVASLAASCVSAQTENVAVTQAADNPSAIQSAIAGLNGVSIQAFASEVIDAIATKPKNPVAKVLSLVEASCEFLAASDESNLADVIVAMISNVPFEALPEWTTQMIAPVADKTSDIEETAYNKLVADVVTKIGDLDEFEDSDKVVVTAFAIKLLSRGKDDYAEDPIRSAIAAVPEEYRGQVEGSLGDVLAGDYSGLLAGIDVISIPASDAGAVPGVPGTSDAAKPGTGSESGESGFEDTKGVDALTDKDPDVTPPTEPTTPSTPTPEKPPVAPTYKEQ